MEHNTQFAKHQIIFCETLGVCEVSEITNLAPKKSEPILYYKLQSLFNAEKIAYIPVLEHKTLLRELLTTEDAKILKESESFKNLSEVEQQEIEYILSQVK
ncbi:MAG: CarD-like/TRCF domain protein [Clostridia bacterium]|nr:CarD-like/TRCF domain protein [Clostridia bacterium]